MNKSHSHKILYDSTYLKKFRVIKIINIESIMVVTKSWRERRMGSCCLVGIEFHLYEIKSYGDA